jgi:hypothetical protein
LRNVIGRGCESIDRDTLWQILVEDLHPFERTIDAYRRNSA